MHDMRDDWLLDCGACEIVMYPGQSSKAFSYDKCLHGRMIDRFQQIIQH